MDEAKVFGDAKVLENAFVSQRAIVKDNAEITGEALIKDHVIIGGDTLVRDDVFIGHTGKIFLYAQVLDTCNGKVIFQPHISGFSRILGESVIEATGSITDCELYSVSLFGHLTIKDEDISLKR